MATPADPVERVMEALRRRTGLRVDDHHRARIAGTLDLATASARAVPDEDLPLSPALYDALVDAVTIDETYFFRHRHQLTFLRSEILPALLAQRRPDHVLHLWSAGCANGAEPYTLALILMEMGLQHRATVLGTDISAEAIERAGRAIYSRWSRRSPELATRADHFSPTGSSHAALDEAITRRVSLQQHNLLDPPPGPAGGFDVILCRNVLLHMTPAAVQQVVPRLVDALAPGGWLITAPADPPVQDLPGAEGLVTVALPTGGVVHRRADGIPARTSPPAPSRPARRLPGRGRRSTSRRRADLPVAAPTAPPQTDTAGAVDGQARCRRAQDLLAAGAVEQALAEATAAVFLAPDLAVGHLVLGMAAQQCGRRAAAARAFRRASDLLSRLPSDTVVELGDGETAACLADMARAHALLTDEGAA